MREHRLAALPEELGRGWVSHVGAWHAVCDANRRGSYRRPHEAQLKRELMRKSIALVKVAASTEMFADVARALDVGIWEETSARGERARAVGERALLA